MLFKPIGLCGTINAHRNFGAVGGVKICRRGPKFFLCIYGTTETNWFKEHQNLNITAYFETCYRIWIRLQFGCSKRPMTKFRETTVKIPPVASLCQNIDNQRINTQVYFLLNKIPLTHVINIQNYTNNKYTVRKVGIIKGFGL